LGGAGRSRGAGRTRGTAAQRGRRGHRPLRHRPRQAQPAGLLTEPEMSELIRVPDIGGEGEVIEIRVEEGQRIEAEQSLVVLESDKARMEVPAPRGGVIRSLKFRLGDKLKEGDPLLELDDAD